MSCEIPACCSDVYERTNIVFSASAIYVSEKYFNVRKRRVYTQRTRSTFRDLIIQKLNICSKQGMIVCCGEFAIHFVPR